LAYIETVYIVFELLDVPGYAKELIVDVLVIVVALVVPSGDTAEFGVKVQFKVPHPLVVFATPFVLAS
jgi:hypothetical protein